MDPHHSSWTQGDDQKAEEQSKNIHENPLCCVKTRALDPPQQRGQLHNSKCWKNHELTVQKLIVLSEK